MIENKFIIKLLRYLLYVFILIILWRGFYVIENILIEVMMVSVYVLFNFNFNI